MQWLRLPGPCSPVSVFCCCETNPSKKEWLKTRIHYFFCVLARFARQFGSAEYQLGSLTWLPSAARWGVLAGQGRLHACVRCLSSPPCGPSSWWAFSQHGQTSYMATAFQQGGNRICLKKACIWELHSVLSTAFYCSKEASRPAQMK